VKAEQDRALDEMLRRALAADAGGKAAGACLDAETAAAWMENALSAADRAEAEAHVAGCPRCQSLLAAIARTDTAPVAAGAWWRSSAIRWLAPAAAAAGLAIVLLLLPSPAPRQPETQVARSEPAAASAAKQSQPSAALDGDQRERAAAPRPSGQMKEEVRRESKAPARLDDLKKTRQEAASADNARAKDVRPAKPDSDIAAAAPAAAPLPPVATLPATPPPAATDALAKSTPRAGGAGGATDGVAAGRTAAPVAVDRLRYGVAETVNLSREAISPDPQSRWRLVSPSTVERSTDGGRTWTAQDVPPHANLTAAVAPAPTICWIVGRAGTVLLTVDGHTWQTLAFPEAVDLVAITASSADAATVTTADGRTFATSDRGRTWLLR
jgi:putative zinc finger protein/photosynthesis system II assembly factor YCF48-like protein